MNTTPATLIGVPLDLGAKNLGVDIGPNAFRYQHLTTKLNDAGLEIQDAGNIPVTAREKLQSGDPRLKYLDEIVKVNEVLATEVETALRASRKAIVLGGDHSVNLGAFSGASAAVDGNIGLIYFDVHGDMNTHETTPSGNIHGMHLASLMGFGADALKTVHGTQIKLAKENLLHIGGNDWDQAELELIEREKLNVFTLFDVLTKGLGALVAEIDSLAAKVPNIWISLDLDSIDKLYAPGAGMPSDKGLSYREIALIAEYIGSHCNVIGIDVVEYNPLNDKDNMTAELGIELIARFFGRNYSWYANYLTQNAVN